MNLACHYALCLNLHTPLRENHAVELAGDGHMVPFNLALDAGVLTKHQAMARDHVSLYVGIYAEHAGSFQGSFKPHALVEEAGKVRLNLFFATIFGSPL